jgi:hypothetical protein
LLLLLVLVVVVLLLLLLRLLYYLLMVRWRELLHIPAGANSRGALLFLRLVFWGSCGAS